MKKLNIIILFILTSCASYMSDTPFTYKKALSYGEHERHIGDLYLSQNKMAPIIFVVHGGGWSNRSLEDMEKIAKSLASHGFNVFNINYRLAPEHHHPAPVEDLEKATQFIKANYSDTIDTNRIGFWGYSSGAHTTLLYSLKNNIGPIVGGGGPYDLTWWPGSPIITPYMGYERDDNIQGWLDASPISYLTKESPPIFLYHGHDDDLVNYEQMTNFGARAKLQGIEFESHLVDFWGHATTFIFSDEAVKKGVLFLKKKLK